MPAVFAPPANSSELSSLSVPNFVKAPLVNASPLRIASAVVASHPVRHKPCFSCTIYIYFSYTQLDPLFMQETFKYSLDET